LSGVKTEMAGTMLTWMQDHEADGMILLGPPGSAKSARAKATGNTAGIPTIAFDLTAMESSLVGASGDRLRTALKVVEAVSQGRETVSRVR
jgi:SpoVK/Ycf46/Vps4 family AAA+-type ATPase